MITVLQLDPSCLEIRDVIPRDVALMLMLDGLYHKVAIVDTDDMATALAKTSTDRNWVNSSGMIVEISMTQCRPTGEGDILIKNGEFCLISRDGFVRLT